MKIFLHIGPEQAGAAQIQKVLADKREQLLSKGILFPRSLGPKNHTRLFMAVTDPDRVDPLRFNRGYITADRQNALYQDVAQGLAKEVEAHQPHTLIVSAEQLAGGLSRTSELERLKSLLTPHSRDITVVAHLDNQAPMMARAYAAQVLEGRTRSLDLEHSLADAADWWEACLDHAPDPDPVAAQYFRVQTPLFWLDYARLATHWENVFGSVALRSYDEALFASPDLADEVRESFGITDQIGKAEATRPPAPISAASLTRGRQLNDILARLLAQKTRILPRQLWQKFLAEVAVPGAPIDPACLSPLAARFDRDNAALVQAHPGLSEAALRRPAPKGDWAEADPTLGYRASQYLTAFLWRIDKATAEEREGKLAEAAGGTPATPPEPELSAAARTVLPPLALEKLQGLVGSPFAPHNRIGAVDEEAALPPYDPAPPRHLPEGSTGRVIVGCMKNEAPYILEWVAYHRAVGFDNFLIYTNDCTDGTDQILQRLMELGIVEHRNNDGWKGNSPQQWALDCALDEPVLKNADWIAHIDVDEFVNIRCGNGTLDDFFARAPGATNIAMTWRLFGHSGVARLNDGMVIDQFDMCAPKFCPKPHTVWGFKTMFRNIGAYAKISCHRPNKLLDGKEAEVQWVNGNAQPTTREMIKNGWRSSKKSVGYDLIQLNHYALRSAESYLIKRQRGRALHVDRSIGLNYWIRMDWSDYRDITIRRNVPRVRAEIDRLLEDDRLRMLHEAGFEWHKVKAAELHATPEFEDLYQQALALKLTETERVAYALALDLES